MPASGAGGGSVRVRTLSRLRSERRAGCKYAAPVTLTPPAQIVPVAEVVEHQRHGAVLVAGYRVTPTKIVAPLRSVRAWVRGRQARAGQTSSFYAEQPEGDTEPGAPPAAVIAYLDSLRPREVGTTDGER